MKQLLLWAARDILRRPGTALISSISICLLSFVLSIMPLMGKAMEFSDSKASRIAPDICLNRNTPTGWGSIPIKETQQALQNIAGITRIKPRIWGHLAGTDRRVLVLGIENPTMSELTELGLPSSLQRGEAAIGSAVVHDLDATHIELRGHISGEIHNFKITQRLPSASGLLNHDWVLLHRDNAQNVLGIPPGHATDFALYTFHQQEAEVLVPEITKALPFGSKITTKNTSSRKAKQALGRTIGGYTLWLAPGLLGLFLFGFMASSRRFAHPLELGLKKLHGWSGGDIVTSELFTSAIIGVPSFSLGFAMGFIAIVPSQHNWLKALMTGNSRPLSFLHIPAPDLISTFIVLGVLVLVPWTLSGLWPAIQSAKEDPADIIAKGAR